jgi:hypothetical protein
MDGAAVEQIAGLARKPLELAGFLLRPNDWCVDDPAALVKAGPTAKTLLVSTLGAVRDYVQANRDGLDLTRLVVHVASPVQVHVLGPLDARARSRELFVGAVASDLADGFLGRYMDLEEFVVGLQVRFADADDRKRLLALLSNVKHETVKTALDDGVTQVVQARAGVALVSEVAVPNPVLLCGFRTFRDVAQPSALYVLRVQSGKVGGLPQVGLFEADGGAWRLSAMARIADWLRDELMPEHAVMVLA